MATAPEHFSPLSEIAIRAMAEPDVPEVVAIEITSYRFPWSEGIFRDCLKVGYVCRVALQFDVVGRIRHRQHGCGGGAYPESVRSPGAALPRDGTLLLEDLLQRAAAAAVDMAYLEVRPSNTAAIRLYQAFEFEHIGPGAATIRRRTAARMRPSSSWR